MKKRIALSVVTALAGGLLVAAPASAAEVGVTTITLTSSATPAAASAVTVTIDVTAPVSSVNTDTWTLKGAIIAKPAGASAPITTTAGSTSADGTTLASTGSTAGLGKIVGTSDGSSTIASKTFGTMAFTPTLAGSYTMRVWNDTANAGVVDPGEVYQDIVISVGAAALATEEAIASSALTAAKARVDAVSIVTKHASGRVGTPVTFFPAWLAGAEHDADTNAVDASQFKATLRYSITSKPVASSAGIVEDGTTTASALSYVIGSGNIADASTTDDTQQSDYTHGAALAFTPDVAGDYTVTIYHDADGNSLVNAGEAVATKTFTVAADSAPTISFTTWGSQLGSAANGSAGLLVKISLKNGSLPASLKANESIALTFSSGTTAVDNKATWGGTSALPVFAMTDSTSTTLTREDFDASGNAYVNVYDSAAAPGTVYITATASGGSYTSSYAVSTSVSWLSDTTYDAQAVNANYAVTNTNAGLGVAGTSLPGDATTSEAWATKSDATTTVKFTSDTAAGKVREALVTDTDGVLTGLAGATYKISAALASDSSATTTTLSVTASLAKGDSYSLTFDRTNDATITVTGADAVAKTLTVTPSAIRAAAGYKVTSTGVVKDQFGNLLSGISVTPSVAGRNATAGAQTALVSDATGTVSYTLTDASTSTSVLQDVLTLTVSTTQTGGAAVNGTTTVNVATGAIDVKTVTVTGGATADTGTAFTTNAIATGASGADSTSVTMTATVKDSNGNLVLDGVPCTWASSLAGSGLVLSYDTTYTAGGACTTKVYSTKTGTSTITATVGGVSATGKINFVNTATDARIVSAAVSGNVVTATVVDRFGNLVKGVTLYATRTGSGFFGNGASSTSGATNAAGVVEFAVTPGATATEVTVSAVDPAAVPSTTYGQTSDLAGKVAGTAVVATGAGASLAPAGVKAASVTVAAAAAPAASVGEVAAKAAADAATAAANAAAAAAAKAGTDAVAAAATAKAAADAAAAAAAKAGTDAVAAAAAAGVKAEAATAAAKAASDAVAAVSTAVAGLQTTVASLVASMTAQIKVINASMLKIAKKLGVKI